ncbi:MAG: CoA-binding protein [Syntrophorhabdaceae bacterium]|nr:CoA-binding protein [Syntrophorhabdaceae bacterium]
MESIDEIKKGLLEEIKTIAIIGISNQEDKPSFRVARYLKNAGYKIIPVNPKYEEVLGEKCFPSLSSIPEKVDVVDIFMKADTLLPVVEEAIKLRPKCIWLQLGIINEEAKRMVEGEGILFFMDQCIKMEHERLMKHEN